MTQQSDDQSTQFLVFSSAFDLDPAEQDETNPLMFGRELAKWLAERLRDQGFDVEDVFAEDHGWYVMCRFQPYRSFVICVSAYHGALFEKLKNPELDVELLWCIVTDARKPLLRRKSANIDFESGRVALTEAVWRIIEEADDVRWASKEEVDDWNNGSKETDQAMADYAQELYPPPQPMSPWITVTGGLLLLPIILVCFIGGLSVLLYPPDAESHGLAIMGSFIVLACITLLVAAVRLIIRRPVLDYGFFPPLVLRLFSAYFLLLPAVGLFNELYTDHPVTGALRALVSIALAAVLWRLAGKQHADEKRRQRD